MRRRAGFWCSRARPSATPTRSRNCWRGRTRGRTARRCSRCCMRICCSPATPLSTRWHWATAGASNAGRPMLLEGGLDWKPMSLTPKDMDFLEAKHTAAREIALAFGVPPMLLGIPGDNTFANYAEANRTFFRQTVLPLASRVGAAIAQWLAPQFGEAIRVVIDTDRIDALAADRAALWDRVSK